jgi:hypothetical protein
MKNILAFATGFGIMSIIYIFIILPSQSISPSTPEPTISKCDSIVFANDSLKQQIQVLNNRIIQYKIGLQFLKDKDKKSYDYVINAGNFIFND